MNLPLDYLFAGSLLLLAVAMATVMAVLPQLISKLFKLNKNQGDKYQSYECGMDPVGGARVRFSIKFYVVAMLFILFDIEVIFLYPVAIQLREFGTVALVETIVFIVLLFIAFIYVWRRGALNWR